MNVLSYAYRAILGTGLQVNVWCVFDSVFECVHMLIVPPHEVGEKTWLARESCSSAQRQDQGLYGAA